MACSSRSGSLLKATVQENKEKTAATNICLETEEVTEIDVEVPMFTDEDINTIVQDIDEKVDEKSESSSKTKSMSTIKDIPVSETQPYLDSKIDDSVNQPSADDSTNSNTSLEIDTIHKHVEESLLFLDHEKTNIVTEKTDQNFDQHALIDPTSELELKVHNLEEKNENKLKFPDSDCENKDSSDPLQPSVKPSKQNNENETTKAHIDQIINANVDIPEKIDEDIENHVNSVPSQLLEEEEYQVSVKLEQNTTNAPEKMDEDVQLEPVQASSKLSELSSTQKVDETIIPAKQDENATEAQKMDKDVKSEPSKDCSVEESTQNMIEDIIVPVEVGETDAGVSNVIEENKESSMEENTEGEEISPENINNAQQEIVWECRLTEQEQSPEKMDEHIVIHETISESSPLGLAQNETSEVSVTNGEPTEPMKVRVQENVQESATPENVEKIVNNPENISSNLEDVTDSSKGEDNNVKIDKNADDNAHFQSSDIASIETAQEMKDIEEMGEDEKIADLEPPRYPHETVDGSPMTADDKAMEASCNIVENVASIELACAADNVCLESLEIVPMEIAQENTDNEEMGEPSQGPQDSVDGSHMIENDKDIKTSTDKEGNFANIEPTHATFKHESVWECSVISNNTQKDEKNEVPDNIPSEPSEIAFNQENIEKTTSGLGNKIEDPEIKNESLCNNDETKPPKSAIKQESVEERTVTVHGNHLKSQDNNMHIETTKIVTIPQNVWESRITVKTEKETNVPVNQEKLVYNANSAHQGALKAIPKLAETPTKKKVDNVIYYEKSAHSGSLTVVPIQDTTKKVPLHHETHKIPEKVTTPKKIPINQETPKIPKKVTTTKNIPEKVTENLTYNAKSVHSGSLKVVHIQDNITECTPAKRARVEPTWSAVIDKTDETEDAHSNTTNEPATPIWSQNPSSDDSELCSAAPLDVSAQWETAQEQASNRSQSSCSSILDDTPMDVDSDDDTSVHGDIDVEELANWCAEHKICNASTVSPEIYTKQLLAAAKYNTGVLQLNHIPKTLNQADVYQLIKKYTWDAGKEISKNIAFVHLDKVPSLFFNAAYIKWRDEDKVLAIKAAALLKRADLTLEDRKLIIKYDDRSKIDWDAKNKPIIKPRSGLAKKEKPRYHRVTRIAHFTVAPFVTGQIDYQNTDTYGLSNDFLSSLDVTPPLKSCDVIVDNLLKDMEERKILKVFGIAGVIRSWVLEPRGDCQIAKIEYEHPLEAVQAISIFHLKNVYGQPVSVTLNKSAQPYRPVLPEGCRELGPGLGNWGTPLKGVRLHAEVGLLRINLNKEMEKLKHKLNVNLSKLKEALVFQTDVNKNLKQAKAKLQQNTTEPKEETPQNISALQQNQQNAITTLSTVIASSIQNNLLGMLGVQPNLLQGLVPQNQNSVAPNWSAPNTDSLCWTHPNAQPDFSANIQMQPGQPYQQPDLSNMQPTSNIQPVPNMQPVSNIQPVPNVQPSLGTMQYTPNVQLASALIQPSLGNEQAYTQPGYSHMPGPSNIQSGYTQTTNVTGFSNQAPSKSDNPSYKSRFDIPPVVAKPQNRGQTQTLTPTTTQINPPLPPEPVKEFMLDIPLPVAKPQNRGTKLNLTAKTAFKKTSPAAPVTKAPKPVGIKFNIPSLVPANPSGELDLIPPPVPKPQKRDVPSTSQPTKKPAYQKASSPLPKAKSPVKELPWINKQIKAMRRSSKSPERSRNRSPRYDKLKEDRRSREKEYSREREWETTKEREPERDNRRPATVIFRYLPSSVSSPDLRDKMQELGKLVSAQVNGKGHAVVTFKYTRDAETCIEMYNKAKVDGQQIEVKWAK